MTVHVQCPHTGEYFEFDHEHEITEGQIFRRVHPFMVIVDGKHMSIIKAEDAKIAMHKAVQEYGLVVKKTLTVHPAI